MSLQKKITAAGFKYTVLEHASGARAIISHYGAHLMSWQDATGQEALFVSRNSWFAAGRPIRGGVPLVFPQFCDEGPLPRHGLVRTREWTLQEQGRTAAGEAFVRLALESDAESLHLWPHHFRIEFAVRLAKHLTMELCVRNTGDHSFAFQNALHTYFAVHDISRTQVRGLHGLDYADSLRDGARARETRDLITFDGEIDRAYQNAPDTLNILNLDGSTLYCIKKSNTADAVVWNPWHREAERVIEDLAANEYKNMLCVETGNIISPVELAPGQEWQGATSIARGN